MGRWWEPFATPGAVDFSGAGVRSLEALMLVIGCMQSVAPMVRNN